MGQSPITSTNHQKADQSNESIQRLRFTYPEVGVAHEEASGGGVTRCGRDQSLGRDAQQLALVEVVQNGAEVSLRESGVGSQARVLLLVPGIALVRLFIVISVNSVNGLVVPCRVIGWRWRWRWRLAMADSFTWSSTSPCQPIDKKIPARDGLDYSQKQLQFLDGTLVGALQQLSCVKDT